MLALNLFFELSLSLQKFQNFAGSEWMFQFNTTEH